jgi:hypothetical protein
VQIPSRNLFGLRNYKAIALIERVVSAIDFTTVILDSTWGDGGTFGLDSTPIESATASCFTSALRLAVES